MGDWTPAIWRSPKLAEAAAKFSSFDDLEIMREMPEIRIRAIKEPRSNFESTEAASPGSFPILKSKGTDGQMLIRSTPDDHWIPSNRSNQIRKTNVGGYAVTDRILNKAGCLLVTFGQDSSTGRLTAVAADEAYVGTGWMPVSGMTSKEAKAIAVFINSTAGRVQVMSNASRKITFPQYNPASIGNIRIPDFKDDYIRSTLADCWERTKDMEVPQFRDGECEVRRLWDEAVAEAMGWDADELARLRHLLHREPHVSGLGYNQYADEVE